MPPGKGPNISMPSSNMIMKIFFGGVVFACIVSFFAFLYKRTNEEKKKKIDKQVMNSFISMMVFLFLSIVSGVFVFRRNCP